VDNHQVVLSSFFIALATLKHQKAGVQCDVEVVEEEVFDDVLENV